MRTYSEFLQHLNHLQEHHIKPGLHRVNRACEILGRPERQFRSIHIAGTNGKGSTAAFLESILRNNGYTVGLFTSPHLIEVRERIQIDRKWISEDGIAHLSYEVRKKCGHIGLSYFEFLTVITFLYFSRSGVDIAIFETGLGGRWDATTVIQPLLTIMAPIAIDHTSFLGDSLISIAREKCGIIKEGVPLISAEQNAEVRSIICEVCNKLRAPLMWSERVSEAGEISLPGDHQIDNASLAVNAARELTQLGFNIKRYKGPLNHTYWPGRLETVCNHPELLLDGAHNPHACSVLSKYINEKYRDRKVVVIFGAMKDKHLSEMVDHIKEFASGWVLFGLGGSRAVDLKYLKSAVDNGEKVSIAGEPSEAIRMALEFGFKNPLVVVTGSLYLVGLFMKRIGGRITYGE